MPLRDLGLLVTICLVWAGNSVMSKVLISQLGCPPLFYAAVRFAVVAAAMSPWLRPVPRPLWRMIVVGLLMGGGTFALTFVGLKTTTPSALAVVTQLSVPISTLLSVIMLGERIRWRRGIGWMKDKFGLCWQIVPRKIAEYVSTPGGMRAMMPMMKLDIAKLEKAAGE